jgi:septal ring factor EnvC (AmiA/AmiB activator)
VILKANGIEQTSQINVLADPRIGMSQEDHEKKVKSLLTLRDLQTATHKIIDNVVSINSQLKELKSKLSMLNDKKWEALVTNVDNLKKDSESFLDDILKRPPPSMNYRQKPRLREEIRSLMSAIDNTTNPPTVQQNERILSLRGELRDAESMMSKLKNEIESINNDSVQLPTIAME